MKHTLSKKVVYILLALGAVVMLFPFLWMLSASLMTTSEITSQNPRVLFPETLQWENFRRVMEFAPFDRFFINSVIVTIISTFGDIITAILAAYAFANMNFWGKNVVFAVLLGTMMVPSEVLLIPNFVTMANLGLIDTLHAIYIPWLASILSIFLLRQFFMSIPKQLSYAAKVDGCSGFKYLWYVVIPNAKPAIITVAVLSALNSWNAFAWPMLVTLTTDTRTLPIGLALFRNEAVAHFELVMTASLMTVIPMLLLFIFLQKYIVAGVSRSGIKG